MKAALGLLLVTSTLVLAGHVFAEVLPTAEPVTVDVSRDRLSRIRTVLQKEIDADRMPGAVVMIARRGQLIYSEAIGFQDKAAGKPMTKDAIFRIYSMTKPLASVAAMMLVEEGRMQLTDPVAKFLPQFACLALKASTCGLAPVGHSSGSIPKSNSQLFTWRRHRGPSAPTTAA